MFFEWYSHSLDQTTLSWNKNRRHQYRAICCLCPALQNVVRTNGSQDSQARPADYQQLIPHCPLMADTRVNISSVSGPQLENVKMERMRRSRRGGKKLVPKWREKLRDRRTLLSQNGLMAMSLYCYMWQHNSMDHTHSFVIILLHVAFFLLIDIKGTDAARFIYQSKSKVAKFLDKIKISFFNTY